MSTLYELSRKCTDRKWISIHLGLGKGTGVNCKQSERSYWRKENNLKLIYGDSCTT